MALGRAARAGIGCQSGARYIWKPYVWLMYRLPRTTSRTGGGSVGAASAVAAASASAVAGGSSRRRCRDAGAEADTGAEFAAVVAGCGGAGDAGTAPDCDASCFAADCGGVVRRIRLLQTGGGCGLRFGPDIGRGFRRCRLRFGLRCFDEFGRRRLRLQLG